MLINKYELFVFTVEDLKKRIRANNYYDTLRACGLCRQLLLDEHPLIFAIGNEYHKAITFCIPDVPDDDFLLNIKITPFPISWVTIYPISNIFKKTKSVGIKDFLQIPLLKFNNHIYSVKEVIQAGSNIMGGTHLGRAKNQKENFLLALDRAAKGGEKLTFFALSAISKVVHDALKPIARKVKKEHAFEKSKKLLIKRNSL